MKLLLTFALWAMPVAMVTAAPFDHDPPALCAQYQISAGLAAGTSITWSFQRTKDRVVTEALGYSEIWTRADNGSLSLQRVFHADKKIVEYSNAELDTRRQLPKWTEVLDIPARIQRGHGGSRIKFELVAVGPPESCPTPSEIQLIDYGRIDIADFGDMEDDPFVRKVMASDGARHTAVGVHVHDH